MIFEIIQYHTEQHVSRGETYTAIDTENAFNRETAPGAYSFGIYETEKSALQDIKEYRLYSSINRVCAGLTVSLEKITAYCYGDDGDTTVICERFSELTADDWKSFNKRDNYIA